MSVTTSARNFKRPKKRKKPGVLAEIAPRPILSAADQAFVDDMRALEAAVHRAKRNEGQSRRALRRRAPLGPREHVKPRRPGSLPSPYRGVTWNIRDSLWVARIKVKGKSIGLGVYLSGDAREAAKLYDRWAFYYFGASAKLNFPEHMDNARITIYRPEPVKHDPDGEKIKRCSRCHLDLPLRDFSPESRAKLSRLPNRPDDRRAACKSCRKKIAGSRPCIAAKLARFI